MNNSRNSFRNKVGGQKSAFFEISIEIKSAQQVSCSQVSSFDTFALLKRLFGEQQISLLADLVQATLMLNYNKRSVGSGLG